jgi:hypothetical protein
LSGARTLAAAAVAIVHIDDRRLAGAVADRLAPLCGTHLVAAGGVVYWGAAAHWLGALAAVLGQPGVASDRLHQALEEHRRITSRPFQQRTEQALRLLSR